MKLFFNFLFAVVLCAFTTPIYSGMILDGDYESTNSAAYTDILVTETGFLKGVNSEFLQLTIKGVANLDSCLMKEEVISYGGLIAHTTEFLREVTICSGNATFTACLLENLYIADDDEMESINPLYVTLNGATIVNGSIVFETGEGLVYKTSDVIILGEVIGGTVIDLDY